MPETVKAPRLTTLQRERLKVIAKAGTYYVGRHAQRSIEALERKGLIEQVPVESGYLPLKGYGLSAAGHHLVDRWDSGRRA